METKLNISFVNLFNLNFGFVISEEMSMDFINK